MQNNDIMDAVAGLQSTSTKGIQFITSNSLNTL